MKYRAFGKTGFVPSALGFGAMRLPKTGPDPTQVDEEQSINMIRYAIDHGVNYVDTAYGYHRGVSEVVVGKALADGYRGKVALATKLPIYLMQDSSAEADTYLAEQLKRLNTDHIDFYLLHNIHTEIWPKVKKWDLFTWAEKQKAAGKIGHFGFSFHDGYPLFKEVIDFYPGWEFTQLQYNYLDENAQAGRAGVEYAASKGVGVIVMEPIRGGALATAPSPEIQSMFDTAPRKMTPAEWALQWVWDQKDAAFVLSGMSNMQQTVENVAAAERSEVGSMSDSEKAFISSLAKAYKALLPVPCTTCGYCTPCPQGVAIPDLFSMYNDAIGFSRNEARIQMFSQQYEKLEAAERADACIECGICEERCPQHIPIRKFLKDVHSTLAAKPAK